MRDPDNLHNPYEYLETPESIIKINELPEYNIQDWDLNDEKEFKKYITTIERIVRGSFEYRAMIRYLREYLDMNKCSFYANVNNIDTTKIQIEIHHEPLSLYDICLIIYNKKRSFNESLDEEAVAKEVMYVHYNLMVGLIPLAATVHELVHNQYLFIPTTKIFGKYKEFVNRYEPWMLHEQLLILDKIEKFTQYFEDSYKTLLSKQYIYIDISGIYDFPQTSELMNSLKVRINDIINGNESKVITNISEESKNLIKPMIFYD